MPAPTEQPPERVLRIDVTDDTRLAAAIAELDEATRTLLAEALRGYEDGEHEREILETIRATVAEAEALEATAEPDGDRPTPVGVLFCSDEWDDGYYISHDGTVLFADGTTTDCDFVINDPLTAIYGRTGATATLAVDLRTGTLEFDDYGSNTTIHEHFGVSEPAPSWRADDPATEAWWREHGGLPDDLTIDGITFDDAAGAIGYLILKQMPPEQVLYLARSDPDALVRRGDKVYARVATRDTDRAWVRRMAARVAVTHGWIDHDEYTRLTTG